MTVRGRSALFARNDVMASEFARVTLREGNFRESW
jgi:hypothetical protein